MVHHGTDARNARIFRMAPAQLGGERFAAASLAKAPRRALAMASK